jgi:hypothetical protein
MMNERSLPKKGILIGLVIVLVVAVSWIIFSINSRRVMNVAGVSIASDLTGKIVAEVNGDRISAAYLKFLYQTQTEKKVGYPQLLDLVIENILLSKGAAEAGLTESPEVKSGVRRACQDFYLDYLMAADKKPLDKSDHPDQSAQFLLEQTKGKKVEFSAVDYGSLLQNEITADEKKTVVAGVNNLKITLGEVIADLGAAGDVMFITLDSQARQKVITNSLQMKMVEAKFQQAGAAQQEFCNELVKRVQQADQMAAYCYFLLGEGFWKGNGEVYRNDPGITVSETEIRSFYQNNDRLFMVDGKQLSPESGQAKAIARQSIQLEKEKALLETEVSRLRQTAAVKKFDRELAELERSKD